MYFDTLFTLCFFEFHSIFSLSQRLKRASAQWVAALRAARREQALPEFWALTLALALPLVHAPAVLYCQMMSICMYQIKTCFLTKFCKAPFGANTNNESHPDVLLRAVYNWPWANTGYSMNSPTFSRVWPCDLCIETQYAGTIGNCTRLNANGRPEFSQETGMLHLGRGITLPFCVPVSNFTKIKFL